MPLLLESLMSLMKERVVPKFCKEGYKFKENIKEIYAILGKGRIVHSTASVHNCQVYMLSKDLPLPVLLDSVF